MRGMLYQLTQPLQPGFFFPGAENPPGHCLSIRSTLRVKVFPRDRILFQLLSIGIGQLDAALFIGVDSRAILLARSKGFETRGVHQALIRKFLHTLDVDRAPGAALFPGSEADGIAEVVNPSPDSINPAKTKRFID